MRSGAGRGQCPSRYGRYDQSEDVIRDAETAYREFCEYVWRRTREEGGTKYGGVGEALIAAWRVGNLDDKQLLSYFALFLLTGMDTLTYAIGNSLWFLGNTLEVFSALRTAPRLAGASVRRGDEAVGTYPSVRAAPPTSRPA